MSQLEIKPSLESYHLAELAIKEELDGEESNNSLKDAWVSLGNQLLIEGIPAENISVVATKLLLEKKSEKTGLPKEELRMSGYFYRVYNSQGWINPSLGRPSNETFPLGEKENSSINTQITTRLNILSDLVSTMKQKVKESPGLDSKLTDDQYEEWDTILQILEDALNEKTKVPINIEQLLLFRVASSISIFDAGIAFFEDRLFHLKKTKSLLTSKQIGYYQDNDIKIQNPLLKPDSRDTAIFQRYFGLPCNKCKSWRVKELTHKTESGSNLVCKDCESRFFGKTVNRCRYCQIPLYKETLHAMVMAHDEQLKNGRDDPQYECPECNVDNKLPQELIDYALS